MLGSSTENSSGSGKSNTLKHLQITELKEFPAFLAAPRPPTPLRRHRRIRRATEGQRTRPPSRTRHPLRLAPIPRLPRRSLSRRWKSPQTSRSSSRSFRTRRRARRYAERHVYGDPRASCFHARHALERLVKRVYKVDKTLSPPKVQNLDSYLTEPAFRALVPEAVWQKAEYIRQAGNVAVHGNKPPAPEKALDVVRELFHVVYWAGRTYLRHGAESLRGKTFDESLIPKVEPEATPASIEALEALEAERDAAEEARKEIESELEALRERLAAIKAENEAVPDTHDWNEDKTRKLIIDLALLRAGWRLDQKQRPRIRSHGDAQRRRASVMPTTFYGATTASRWRWWRRRRPSSIRRWGSSRRSSTPTAWRPCTVSVRSSSTPTATRPGCGTTSPTRRARSPGSTRRTSWHRLIHRRAQREPLDVARVKDAIVERYYQKRAIGSIGEHFAKARRKALLVMATGTGKTRTAIALVDLLQRAGWVKRALFLADRVSLVNQAVGAFKAHLPESSPVNLVTEKDKAGRVYVCTYPTMMGLIDETKGQRSALRRWALRSGDHRRGASFGLPEVRRDLPLLRLAARRPDRDAERGGRPEHLRALRPGAGRADRCLRAGDCRGGRLSRAAAGAAGGPEVPPPGHRLRLAQRGGEGAVGEPRLGR